MSEQLYMASERIRALRKRDVEVVVLRGDQPVRRAPVQMRMKRHAFLFGCDCFPALSYEPERAQRYRRYFGELFNYTTLPFYWESYEPRRGETQERRLAELVKWSKELGLSTKGHPLVWQKLIPGWISDGDSVDELLRRRVENILEHFGDSVDYWDLFNEITVAHRYSNPVSRWIDRTGKANAVRFAEQLARSVRPDARLLYNDFNIWGKDCEVLLDELRRMGVELRAVGIQSHMHDGLWPLQSVWDLCERYARFGWPLHFTEATVLSGRYSGRGAMSDDSRPEDWYRGDEYLERQARYTTDLYTLLFSHPAVEAISWWDFQDNDWRSAPAGLVTEDIRPKPAYYALRKLIRETWWSDEQGETDDSGVFRTNVFCGDYDVTVSPVGAPLSLETQVSRAPRGAQRMVIRLA